VPKNLFIESVVYQSLNAARRLRLNPGWREIPEPEWNQFVNSWRFISTGPRQITIEWDHPQPGKYPFNFTPARGDTGNARPAPEGDQTVIENAVFFERAVEELFRRADLCPTKPEESFHDNWARHEDLSAIDPRQTMEAATSPELRFIRATLGDLRGKKLLDLGSGLGEASVYFALEGADVTAVDISSQMLEATKVLAQRFGVGVTPLKADMNEVETTGKEFYDVIYAGNFLHHVNIDETLRAVACRLSPTGTFVSWDPLAYNPVINVYRRIATAVRTPDEHPLTSRDVQNFRKYFESVETRTFWLSTLLIFVLMAVFQRRNPNQERYWKKVVAESPRWEWLYRPLEKLDRLLLAVCPPLKWLCWNMVVVARNPIPGKSHVKS
jgi:2-polyprenyl-3-methyl-5-hydroxy-6-metoxy-1,4-benzoquinol methylase